MASKFFKEAVTWGIKQLPRKLKVAPDITKAAPPANAAIINNLLFLLLDFFDITFCLHF